MSRKNIFDKTQFFITTLALIATGVGITKFYSQKVESNSFYKTVEYSSKDIDSINNLVSVLRLDMKMMENKEAVNDSLIKMLNNPKALQNSSLKFKIYQVENNLNGNIRKTNALIEAFNPTKPEQVITIARLKDAVQEVSNNEKALEDKLKTQQANFEDSIKREMLATSNSNYWIMFILIPIVLQLIYNIYKDNKRVKSIVE